MGESIQYSLVRINANTVSALVFVQFRSPILVEEVVVKNLHFWSPLLILPYYQAMLRSGLNDDMNRRNAQFESGRRSQPFWALLHDGTIPSGKLPRDTASPKFPLWQSQHPRPSNITG